MLIAVVFDRQVDVPPAHVEKGKWHIPVEDGNLSLGNRKPVVDQ